VQCKTIHKCDTAGACNSVILLMFCSVLSSISLAKARDDAQEAFRYLVNNVPKTQYLGYTFLRFGISYPLYCFVDSDISVSSGLF